MAATTGPSMLGPTIVMKGDLSVGEDLIIRGEVHGRIVGTDTVVIKKSARVSGRISAAKIQFEKGARLDGVILSGNIGRKPREH